MAIGVTSSTLPPRRGQRSPRWSRREDTACLCRSYFRDAGIGNRPTPVTGGVRRDPRLRSGASVVRGSSDPRDVLVDEMPMFAHARLQWFGDHPTPVTWVNLPIQFRCVMLQWFGDHPTPVTFARRIGQISHPSLQWFGDHPTPVTAGSRHGK